MPGRKQTSMEPGARIRGQSVTLRPIGDTDLDLLSRWFSDPKFLQWWGGAPLTREEVARKYLGHRPGVEGYIVEEAGAPIGYIQAWLKAGDGGIDIVLEPSSHGLGRGVDAVQTLARFLSEQRGLPRVTVDPLLTNKRAIRAFTKAGFIPERQLLDHPDGPALLMVFDASKPRGI